jgi:hypothetical protein
VAVKRTTTKSTTKAPAARRPGSRRKRTPAVTREEIATRAYFLHLEGGHDPVDNWLRAERELIPA